MFLTLTPDFSVDERSILGIFDLDLTTRSPITRKFLRDSQKKGILDTKSKDIPKSFLVCDGFVCLLQTSSSSLAGREKEREQENGKI